MLKTVSAIVVGCGAFMAAIAPSLALSRQAKGDSAADFTATFGGTTKVIKSIQRMKTDAEPDGLPQVTITFHRDGEPAQVLMREVDVSAGINAGGEICSRRLEVFRRRWPDAAGKVQGKPVGNANKLNRYWGNLTVFISRMGPNAKFEQIITKYRIELSDRDPKLCFAPDKKLGAPKRFPQFDGPKGNMNNQAQRIGGSDDYVMTDSPGFFDAAKGGPIGNKNFGGTTLNEERLRLPAEFETFVTVDCPKQKAVTFFKPTWGFTILMDVKDTIDNTVATVVLSTAPMPVLVNPSRAPLDEADTIGTFDPLAQGFIGGLVKIDCNEPE